MPQSKGRIERLNGSFQSRLPIELRIANKQKKKYISPMSHPWKKYEFRKFINIQLKKDNTEFELLAYK